ncbi:hypothetical protein CEXT_200331 [Caerostris extrusa]|uniref:Uncharacterized protein n=1 Tax=Caerostris extrusa TaxID=172846 RepID=A0AAV4SW17_CAEEX|nr:hypothetical protein CEXT_200331 [Caerostris extrusa]
MLRVGMFSIGCRKEALHDPECVKPWRLGVGVQLDAVVADYCRLFKHSINTFMLKSEASKVHFSSPCHQIALLPYKTIIQTQYIGYSSLSNFATPSTGVQYLPPTLVTGAITTTRNPTVPACLLS